MSAGAFHRGIEVREQAALSPLRILRLCLKGIRHRLFRSVLTMMVIILAVAFFMYLLAGSVFARAVDRGVRAERAALQRAPEALERWFGRPTGADLQRRLAQAPATWGPLVAAVAEADPVQVDLLARDCRSEASLLAFFAGLDSGSRVVLVRKARDRGILAWLADPPHWQEFTVRLAQMRSLRLPMDLEQARRVVQRAPGLEREVEVLAAAWNARTGSLRAEVAAASLGGEALAWQRWMAGLDAGGAARLQGLLAGHGFAADAAPAAMQTFLGDLRGLLLRETVSAALSEEAGRRAWRRAFGDAPPLDEKLLRLGDPRAVEALGGAFTPRELAAVAAAAREERSVLALEVAVAGKVSPDGGLLSVRQAFLVAISFVVCAVGIANAMLMAITERFREIATMKCLGATDGFILAQFLMEAGMQGAAGGACGTVLGLAIALAADTAAYGSALWAWFPLLPVLACAGTCVAAGLVLATLASIYPSWMASRMAPMEAMRVE